VLIREKKESYPFIIINKTAIKQNKGVVRYKTIFMRVIIKKHTEEISLDIIKINNHQVIFDIPWIRQYNPEIN
jgi:hypothetical protein